MKRVCACGCGADLSAYRVDAVYASQACRKRAQRAQRADKARPRLPSRDGKGARVYLNADELRVIRSGLTRLDLPMSKAGNRLYRKLHRAEGRTK